MYDGVDILLPLYCWLLMMGCDVSFASVVICVICIRCDMCAIRYNYNVVVFDIYVFVINLLYFSLNGTMEISILLLVNALVTLDTLQISLERC